MTTNEVRTIWALGTISIAIVVTAIEAMPCLSQDQLPTWNCYDGKGKHVLWRTEIGSFSTSPVIHNNKIFVGADTRRLGDPIRKESLGTLICVSRDDGALLWQATHPRLPQLINDLMGICSKPTVEGDRVYYQSNRGELACLDLEGFRDAENDGPYQEEEQTGPTDADVIWKLDMVRELGVFKRDARDVGNPLPSPLVVGDLVYCVTGNGAAYFDVPKPDAPSFLAVNKYSGKVVWSSSAPGKDICYGQWSSPVFARVQGRAQIVFPGGDGRLYGFEPTTGGLIWKVDCNDPEATAWGRGKRGTRSFFVAVPTVHEHMLYVGMNLDFEFRGDVRCPIYAVDMRHAGNGTPNAIRWKYAANGFDGTFGSVAVDGEILYVLGHSGLLVALDRQTGRELWRSDLGAGPGYFSSPFVDGKKLFAGTDDGDLFLFSAGSEKKCLGRYDLWGSVTGTPVIEDSTVYITTKHHLWALRIPTGIP